MKEKLKKIRTPYRRRKERKTSENVKNRDRAQLTRRSKIGKKKENSTTKIRGSARSAIKGGN